MRWISPVEDFERIFGGEEMTLGMVSRIDVLEGTIGAPEMVVSQ